MTRDKGLDTLLDLDGLRMNLGNGYWAKFEAREVEVTADRPHGIKYSLTLHDDGGERLLGFDNAHAVKVSSGYKGRRFAYDHQHRGPGDEGVEYEFQSPEQLIADFWAAVDAALIKRGE